MADSGRALGLEGEGEQDQLDILISDDPDTGTQQEEPQEEEPQQVEVQQETPETTQPSEEETPEEEAEELLAGRYKTVEDLAAAYKEAQGWGTRESQKRAQLEQEINQLREGIAPFVPHLEALIQQQEEEGDEGGVTPQQYQQQVQQEAERLANQQVSQNQMQQAQQRLAEFAQDNPDANDETFQAGMIRLFEEYRQDDPEFLPHVEGTVEAVAKLVRNPRLKQKLDQLDLLPGDDEIELAEELLENPSLDRVITAHKDSITNEGFLDWAREQADARLLSQGQVQQKRKAEGKKKAFVEKGQTGAPVEAAPSTGKEALLNLIGMNPEDDNPTSALGI